MTKNNLFITNKSLESHTYLKLCEMVLKLSKFDQKFPLRIGFSSYKTFQASRKTFSNPSLYYPNTIRNYSRSTASRCASIYSKLNDKCTNNLLITAEMYLQCCVSQDYGLWCWFTSIRGSPPRQSYLVSRAPSVVRRNLRVKCIV